MTKTQTVVRGRGYYPKRVFRISDEVLEEFRKQKKASGLTWNLFIAELLDYETQRTIITRTKGSIKKKPQQSTDKKSN